MVDISIVVLAKSKRNSFLKIRITLLELHILICCTVYKAVL